ncbi:preprotein translocase subunit SecE [Altererythrobacter luteolus]|uniref:Protein translocase subunit SecE n=1 Tax=Pontixanthobacter luteolus TaxID=295089 RepID=A0A6I4V280_9SPHN|nr:preprotein translocase subunit SecE [Pontixanthobacter luteolus]MXP48409.1 preprotein translocase subunit SecE [Pontixanthobacter luteolus]
MAEKSSRTSPAEFLRQVQNETKKVVWPTRQETITTAIFVGIMMVILSMFFLGVDSVFGSIVNWLLSLA